MSADQRILELAEGDSRVRRPGRPLQPVRADAGQARRRLVLAQAQLDVAAELPCDLVRSERVRCGHPLPLAAGDCMPPILPQCGPVGASR